MLTSESYILLFCLTHIGLKTSLNCNVKYSILKMKITAQLPTTSTDILCMCEMFWLHVGRGQNTLCVLVTKTCPVFLGSLPSAVLITHSHSVLSICPVLYLVISCYNQYMDGFIVQSKQVNSSTHTSHLSQMHYHHSGNPITISLKTYLATNVF